MMNKLLASIFAATVSSIAWPGLGNAAGAATARSARVTQAPFVMRLGTDEFRIAFGIDAKGCVSNGCNGVIRYKVAWTTGGDTVTSEIRRVHYSMVPGYTRTITVDRQYFDTAEGAHTTVLVNVTVQSITCEDGAFVNTQRSALAARRF